MRSLTLYIPGLFGPDTSFQADELPDLPSLSWLLTRAEIEKVNTLSPSTRLCNLFGLHSDAEEDLPIAAISRLSDDNQPPEGMWLRADPVHVSVDRDGLILLDSTRFHLSQHDALSLAAEVNRLLDEHDMALEVPVPYRWYLKLPEAQNLITTPLDMVVGKDVMPYMPRGDDRVKWTQLLNEIQMLLHDSEINAEREVHKQLPVNSLWFWGIGELPTDLERYWSKIYSNDMLTKGLAMVAATPCDELNKQFPFIDPKLNFNYYHDSEGWFEALLDLENNYLAPLKLNMKRGMFDEVIIHTDNLTFRLSKNARFVFWKQKETLHSIKQLIH